MRIPLLRNLSLKDPEYSPAPVSLLCNYSTHVLFHLPHLTKLDTYDVSKPVSDMAEVCIIKGIGYVSLIPDKNILYFASVRYFYQYYFNCDVKN